MNKGFLDIKVGDIVVAANTYSHDYTHWTIEVTTIEYDEDFKTESNPEGMHCYGKCLELENGECGEDDDFITNVDEENFSYFVDCYKTTEVKPTEVKPTKNGRYLVKFYNKNMPEYDCTEIVFRDFIDGVWINPIYNYEGDGYELVGWFES